MSVQIRCATSSDGPAVAQIVRQTFDENIEPGSPRVRKVLRANGTFVAIIGEDVVGFVSNFLTRSAEGLRRFELDLLAVASEARGSGIGDQLVGYSIARASQSGADMIRSLVATHNRAMQRICKGHGFARSSGSYSLFVAEPSADFEGNSPVHRAHLVPVNTLTYSGIWLEGSLSQAAIEAGHARATRVDMSRIGAVIPTDDSQTAALLRANQFDLAGEFHWWTISL